MRYSYAVIISFLVIGSMISISSTFPRTYLEETLIDVPFYGGVGTSLIVIPDFHYNVYKTRPPLETSNAYNISYKAPDASEFYVVDEENFFSWVNGNLSHVECISSKSSNITIVNWHPPKNDTYYIVYKLTPNCEWEMTTEYGTDQLPSYETKYSTLLPSYFNFLGVGLLICGAAIALRRRKVSI
jgi:hypothetical protein